MSGRPTVGLLHLDGDQSSANLLPLSAGCVPTGKMGPSTPMSPIELTAAMTFAVTWGVILGGLALKFLTYAMR